MINGFDLLIGAGIVAVIAVVVLVMCRPSRRRATSSKELSSKLATATATVSSLYPVRDTMAMTRAKRRIVRAADRVERNTWYFVRDENAWMRFVDLEGEGIVVEWVAADEWPLRVGKAFNMSMLVVDLWDPDTPIRSTRVMLHKTGEVPTLYKMLRNVPGQGQVLPGATGKQEATPEDIVRWAVWAELH